MKKRDWTMIIIVFAVVLLSVGTIVCVIVANCMTGNVATMISGAISATATVILGAIAVWQNKRYKQLSEDNAKEIEKLTLTPECYLAEIETRAIPVIPNKIMIPDMTNGKHYYLVFASLNQPMLNVTIHKMKFYNPNRECLAEYPNEKSPFLTNIQTLTVFENYTKFTIEILVPEMFDSQDVTCEIVMEYKNIYNTSIQKIVSFDREQGRIRNIVSNQATIV